MKKLLIIIPVIIFTVFACKSKPESDVRQFVIKTELGDITLQLYNETPQHRDNFINLVEDGYYKDLLFHRIVKNMIIQGGDPKSEGSDQNIKLGDGGPGYKIPAEIQFPKYYHKRGALAAARQADRVNPQKESSGSQFYIVQGMVYDTTQLEHIALRKNDVLRRDIFNKIAPQYKDSMNVLMYSNMPDKVIELQDSIMAEVDRVFLKNHEIFTFNDDQIKTYTTIGGSPFLDNEYTVFGEVISGMEVVDSIAGLESNPETQRPLEDISFTIKMLN